MSLTTRRPNPAPPKETLILDAAQKRFAAYGLNKVTMDEIAADIGMGKASLYYYFPTKEELFCEVVKREQNLFLEHVNDLMMRDVSAAEKLRLYGAQRVDHFRQLLNLQLLSLHSLLSPRPVFTRLFANLASEERERLEEILREGERNGEFEIESPEETAQLLLHLLQGLRLRILKASQIAHTEEASPSDLEGEVGLLMDMILRGITSATHQERTQKAK